MEDGILVDCTLLITSIFSMTLHYTILHTNISFNSSAPMMSEKRFKKKLLKLVQIKELSNHVMNDK